MLRFGQFRSRDCQRQSRRTFLQAGGISALGLSLPALLRQRALAATPVPARSVILLWLWGGPSHLDTFDMKPTAALEYRGPFAPIETTVPGMEVCELLPQLSQQAHRFSLLRSLHHESNDHGIGGTIGLTGSSAGAISLSGQAISGRVQPTQGAVVARSRGARPGMPTFATLGGHLHQGKRQIAGEGGGVLGTAYDPFRLDYDPVLGVKLPQLDLQAGITTGGLDSRRSLLTQLDQQTRAFEANLNVGKLDEFYQQAFSLLTSGAAREVFDIEREPEPVRRRFGRFRFGQCCLLARRLVEAGVSFVQVNWSSHVEPIEDTGDGGWDMHDRNFIQMQDRHAWMLDQATSALLDDLAERGLLDSTVVLAVGEFGRTPKINNKAGRDHWEKCYTALAAGGGLAAGRIVGASDRLAEYPAARAATPADLAATIYQQLGIGTPELTSFGLTPTAEPIEELL